MGEKTPPSGKKIAKRGVLSTKWGGGIGFFGHFHPKNSYFTKNHHFFNPRFQAM
jgi:hypothetical protein